MLTAMPCCGSNGRDGDLTAMRSEEGWEVYYKSLGTHEVAAIKSLERLAKKWPRSLRLFARNGTLEVQRNDGTPPNVGTVITYIMQIPCDGGDS